MTIQEAHQHITAIGFYLYSLLLMANFNCSKIATLLFCIHYITLMNKHSNTEDNNVILPDEWPRAIKDKLNFSSVKITHSLQKNEDLFDGSMYIDELNGDIFKTLVRSSAVTVSLTHKDVKNSTLSKLFFIYSCGNVLVRNKEHREIISPGDALIVPSHDELIIDSPSKRNTISLIMDVKNINKESEGALKKLAWRKTSELMYGDDMNKLLLNYHSNHSDRFCEKNTKALISLLSLELESHDKTCLGKINSDNKFASLIYFIKSNIKNSELCLSSVAHFFNVSERMVQYILSEYNIKFSDFVANERCRLLANKIMNDPYMNVDVHIYESGFNSIASANRQFKNRLGETPRKYQERQKAIYTNNKKNNSFS
ncbi:TPA: helix-turn-helix domain-containing protein [Escherichia coli]|uniref:helix-turn-helix domain-containing protein n=1 Tax=Escherichia coli TaxID=562 RepID=UPI003B7AE72C